MAWVAFGAGLALLILLVIDVYSTVFVPRGSAGVISRQLYRLLWGAWRFLADRRSGERRRLWLAHFGPAMVPLTVAMWGLLLVLSFSLMYAPWVAGFQISPPESGPVPDWALVLYYSGYSAVTLGVGDVTPDGTVPRLMAVIEAGGGFALFTVAVTYLLSIYSARNQSTALALAISRLVGRRDGEDAVSLVVATAKVSSVEGVTDWMGRIAFDLAALIELRGQYPLLHYVHEPNDDRAMPIALTDLLEVVTLCRSVLDPERYSVLASGPTVVAVERMGRHYLASFVPDRQEGSQVYDRDRRRRYDDARDRLAREGIALRAEDEAWNIYQSIARTWDVADDNMREQIGYRLSRPFGTA